MTDRLNMGWSLADLVRKGGLSAVAVLAMGTAASAQDEPLRCGIDPTLAPHAMMTPSGELEGFQIDFFNEVASRLGRELVIEAGEHAGLFPALIANRYDFLCGPITVTTERSQNLLFTEPYLWSESQFIVQKGTPLSTEEDLRGKNIAASKGTSTERWLIDNAERLDLTVTSFGGQSDGIQAVAQGRVFGYTNGSGTGTMQYVASRVPGIEVAEFVLPDSRAAWAAPFRKDSSELRKQVEDAIVCMKLDGTVADISEKWFGVPPADDAAERQAFPGYGTEGFEGYDPTPQEPAC